jgi:small subunit ribosomal protein S16
VAVKIKLKRLGKIRAPYYRIVVADARTKRDGRAIEEIGKYHPKAEPSFIEVNSERAQHWLSVGAQPTDPVRKILEITGDWQKYKGLPGAEGTLRMAEPKADRKIAFAEALQETLTEGGSSSSTRGKARGKGDSAPAKAQRGGKPDKGDSAKSEPKSEAKSEPKPEAKSEAKSEPKPEAKAEAKSEAKAEPKTEAKADSASAEQAPAGDTASSEG